MHALDTDTKHANIASTAETLTEFPKPDWFSLITRETQTEGNLTVDAITQTDRVYTSNWNGDTAQEWINIDILKLLKDEIVSTWWAFSRIKVKSKNNSARKKVLLEQTSHYKTDQRRCDDFQQFDSPNSFTREPSKSLLTSANTTNVPIIIRNENTALEALKQKKESSLLETVLLVV